MNVFALNIMMLSTVQSGVPLQIAAVVAPVSLYFLVLGLLNTRSRPQMLSGRLDFAMLVVALSPLLVCPLLSWASQSYLAMAAAGAVGVAAIWLLSPAHASWVIYNITPAEAVDAVAKALERGGLPFRRRQGEHIFRLPGGQVEFSSFSLLRNVTVRMTGCDHRTAQLFEQALAGRMELLSAQTTPMAMAMLLVATTMLVAPLAMVAPRAVEIVRILTGLLY
jgi:hypothetical protein